jgi:hypothetical protein
LTSSSLSSNAANNNSHKKNYRRDKGIRMGIGKMENGMLKLSSTDIKRIQYDKDKKNKNRNRVNKKIKIKKFKKNKK